MEQHFSQIPKINGEFQFVKVNYLSRHDWLEPLDGIIAYNDKVFYFKYHSDFAEGNRYFVYEQNKPMSWFTLSYPYVNPDNGSPVHDPDEFFEDDRDFESGNFPKWHST